MKIYYIILNFLKFMNSGKITDLRFEVTRFKVRFKSYSCQIQVVATTQDCITVD